MLNQEGEAHLQRQQSIEAVANELIRATYFTASSLQKLACDGADHRKFGKRLSNMDRISGSA
eukprot:6681455-Prorocentrum_lima.AAC.1